MRGDANDLEPVSKPNHQNYSESFKKYDQHQQLGFYNIDSEHILPVKIQNKSQFLIQKSQKELSPESKNQNKFSLYEYLKKREQKQEQNRGIKHNQRFLPQINISNTQQAIHIIENDDQDFPKSREIQISRQARQKPHQYLNKKRLKQEPVSYQNHQQPQIKENSEGLGQIKKKSLNAKLQSLQSLIPPKKSTFLTNSERRISDDSQSLQYPGSKVFCHKSRKKMSAFSKGLLSLKDIPANEKLQKKIKLTGKRLNPLQRQPNDRKLLRDERFSVGNESGSSQKPHYLISSELIYNNKKQSVSKSVYEQLGRRLAFS